jgi:solute carrier family 25 phosphate transporter 23/24/25/41
LTSITREEGPRGWFKGNWTNVLRIAPFSAIQYFSFEQYKRVCDLDMFCISGLTTCHCQLIYPAGDSDIGVGRRLAAGALAGITSSTLTYPLDLVRARCVVSLAGCT